MLTIPIQRSPTTYDLCVVLGDDNLKRIQEYDPCEVETRKLGPPWSSLRIVSVRFCYANAEEERRLASMQTLAEVVDFLNKVLARGFKFRPELGDNDGNYQSPKDQ